MLAALARAPSISSQSNALIPTVNIRSHVWARGHTLDGNVQSNSIKKKTMVLRRTDDSGVGNIWNLIEDIHHVQDTRYRRACDYKIAMSFGTLDLLPVAKSLVIETNPKTA